MKPNMEKEGTRPWLKRIKRNLGIFCFEFFELVKREAIWLTGEEERETGGLKAEGFASDSTFKYSKNHNKVLYWDDVVRWGL